MAPTGDSGSGPKYARPALEEDPHPPPVLTRYFYTSGINIDDAKAPPPAPVASAYGSQKRPPQPFSDLDNDALDKAWLELQKKVRDDCVNYIEQGQPDHDEQEHDQSRKDVSSSSRVNQGSGASDSVELRADHAATEMDSVSKVGIESEDTVEDGSPSSTRPEGTTGRPFARAPSRQKISDVWRTKTNVKTPTSSNPQEENETQDDGEDTQAKGDNSNQQYTTRTPVGVSRLQQVSLPPLKMEPIYWAPVNDVANVLRSTWFYRDSMYPVETEVANMLEAGYTELRPWTQTWKDELNSAVAAGADGEEMIAHTLWPEQPPSQRSSRPGTSASMTDPKLETAESRRADLAKQAEQKISASTSGHHQDHRAIGINEYGKDGYPKFYPQSAVIYSDARDAYILRQNLRPSAYYGRRPLANYIRKGQKIGVQVMRGFDPQIWNTLHPRRTVRSEMAPPSGQDWTQPQTAKSEPQGRKVTDLVLVIHGIGQKLSEKVESFHFTYAMNTFRRDVNIERDNGNMKSVLRSNLGDVMVLPVNWRSTLSFEEGGYKDSDTLQQHHFGLKDITPESLPSVRNIVSDVMLDIPYYLSHHQSKMIAAVVDEANRIYKLWCHNNPGFEDHGRVHLIAHSLGSVMSMDILSNQPTDVKGSQVQATSREHFAFNTTNLFLCGSPVGFFLLLKNAVLRPRKREGTARPEDTDPAIIGEAGTYGCLAVENVYNIINPYDPVAYKLNAAIDAVYAASLKPAFVPTSNTPWFALASPSGGLFGFGSDKQKPVKELKNDDKPSRPPMPQSGVSTTGANSSTNILDIPASSTVELETHNFPREQLAEARAQLLNDTGQVDFFLRYGGGPLDIEYLTMLSAHSSYWVSKDLIRFLVSQVGRPLGLEGVPPSLRALKVKKKRTNV